jgi:protein subunit release factor B
MTPNMECLSEVRINESLDTARILLMEQSALQECVLTITAGAGGAESADWSAILKSLYLRWASQSGVKETGRTDEVVDGKLKQVSLKFSGKLVYGWLKGETGAHRLVRISPHDSQGRRYTSYASIRVRPIHEGTVIDPYEPIDYSAAVPDTGRWGRHVRSYVLHPYQLVKDLRTGHETNDADAVLQGDIDGFLAAYVIVRARQLPPPPSTDGER